MMVKELTSFEEMRAELPILRHLYPRFTQEKYDQFLVRMIPHGYTQIAVYENAICVGITGCWHNVKLWSGDYLEIDNFVVHPDYRSKGIGKLITDFVEQKAINLGCTNIVLDAFTTNFAAHRFYYNQGYAPKGFHFVKILDAEGLT